MTILLSQKRAEELLWLWINRSHHRDIEDLKYWVARRTIERFISWLYRHGIWFVTDHVMLAGDDYVHQINKIGHWPRPVREHRPKMYECYAIRWGVVNPENAECVSIHELKKDAIQYKRKNASAYVVVQVKIKPIDKISYSITG